MAKLTWYDNEVPNELKTRQVYGVIFTNDGRLLLKVETKENGKNYYSLAGGTPEDYDSSRIDTLKRELLEEVNVTIEEPIYIGYQLVEDDNGKAPYAQVRMTAMINNIGISQPDPDTNETYKRLLTSPSRAIELLNWGAIGEILINKSVEVAKNQFNLNTFSDKEEYI